jgi:hypothetical protein
MFNPNPVALFELDDTDQLLIQGTNAHPVVDFADAALPGQNGIFSAVGAYRDRDGRKAAAMIEQIDGDRFWLTSLEAARRFMDQHGMVEVDDKVMKQLRGGAGAD